MSWCKCPFVRLSWCKCANINYSKISFIFKVRFPQHLKPKMFSKLDLLFPKGSSLFWRSLKICDHCQKSLNGVLTWNQMIWLKRFIFTNWLSKGVAHLRPFLEKWILWKSSILKRFIFVVSEYGNLTGVKTYCDSFRSLGKALLNRRFRFIDFGRGWGPQKGFGCCSIVTLSFFCFLRPWVFANFLVSALDCPFGFSP